MARIAAGYTGKSFVNQLAAAWHVSLRSTTGKTGTPQAGHTVTYGTGRLPSGTEIEISALRDHTGTLMSILCRVHGTDTATAAFFAGCAAINAPGMHPAAQASWARAATASVRRSYSAAVGAAHSAPYQSGNLTGSIGESATVIKGTTYTRPEMDLLIYGRSG
ncbi:hypothetical protein POF50_030145 [Streptomyces sp. SL13]|uniref:Uncharacterized protein n=1 Tax=Streptantibioticus silvisoli TaxID=2705255 RepID=A0AA90H7X3_9ACTN|nr:hypothetical protein [Streptantibioticus silvisoli]MDI5973551.1 hypothetical protein [Streptantibioticus silvisoli]